MHLFDFLSGHKGRKQPAVTTKTGDAGFSSLMGGERLPKHDQHFVTLGDLDELSCLIGTARHYLPAGHPFAQESKKIQSLLHHVMAVIASSPDSAVYKDLPHITEQDVIWLESRQAFYSENARISGRFVLPGESNAASAWMDLCRAVCRRGERSASALFTHQHSSNKKNRGNKDINAIRSFLNRLSDYFFVLARSLD